MDEAGLVGDDPRLHAAIAELLRRCGTQFDPEVVAAFQAELAAPSHERYAIPSAARSDDRALSVSAN